MECIMSELKHSSIQGFSSISTDDFIGFTDQDVANFEILIQSLLDYKPTQKVLNLRERILDHIRHGTHEFDAHDHSDEIIASLYSTYRDTGYQGVVADMLLSLVKDVDIGTMSDVLTALSRTKCLNTRGWQHLMHEHEDTDNVHLALYRQYHPPVCFDSPVIYSLDGVLSGCLEDHTLPLDRWSNDEGTIYLDFDFDLNQGEQQVATYLEDDGRSVSILINEARELCFRYGTEADGYQDLATITHEMIMGRCKATICMHGDEVQVRNEISYATVDNVFTKPHSIKLTPSNGVVITEIVGYRHTASPAEQAFLIN